MARVDRRIKTKSRSSRHSQCKRMMNSSETRTLANKLRNITVIHCTLARIR